MEDGRMESGAGGGGVEDFIVIMVMTTVCGYQPKGKNFFLSLAALCSKCEARKSFFVVVVVVVLLSTQGLRRDIYGPTYISLFFRFASELILTRNYVMLQTVKPQHLFMP